MARRSEPTPHQADKSAGYRSRCKRLARGARLSMMARKPHDFQEQAGYTTAADSRSITSAVTHSTVGRSPYTLLARLTELSLRPERVAFAAFLAWVAALPRTGQFSLIEWDQLVNFAADQRAQWRVEWLFSSDRTPNAAAEAEADGWAAIWTRYSATLVERAPAVRVARLGYRDLSAVQYALRRRLEFNRGKPCQKVPVPILGWLGFQFNRLGLHQLGSFVYQFGLYPTGTVGRNRG